MTTKMWTCAKCKSNVSQDARMHMKVCKDVEVFHISNNVYVLAPKRRRVHTKRRKDAKKVIFGIDFPTVARRRQRKLELHQNNGALDIIIRRESRQEKFQLLATLRQIFGGDIGIQHAKATSPREFMQICNEVE